MRGPYLMDLKERKAARDIFRAVGADPAGIELMLEKAGIFPLLLREVKSPAANILKQQMLSLGGEAVVGRWAINNSRALTDVLLLGTLKHYHALSRKLSGQPWGLQGLRGKLENLLAAQTEEKTIFWRWADRAVMLGPKPLVMGILNITPDSFSDGGRYLELDAALRQAERMVQDGADIIDVGGESTRPGSQPVSQEEELNRVMPVLERLLREVPLPLSLDTYKAGTARAAAALGVHILNDVSGAKTDPIARVAAEYALPVIIMHNKKCTAAASSQLVSEIIDDLAESVALYHQAGVAIENMAIDPGIGFGKDKDGNLSILKNLTSFKTLNLPLLVGVSRKSFIGAVLDKMPEERLEGSLAAAFWAGEKGAAILRAHDVKETVRVLKMLEAIRNAGEAHERI